MKVPTCWSSPETLPEPTLPGHMNSHTFFAKLCVLGATALGSLYKYYTKPNSSMPHINKNTKNSLKMEP